MSGQMVADTLESTAKTKGKARATKFGLMEAPMMANGKTINNTGWAFTQRLMEKQNHMVCIKMVKKHQL
jgi:hypothetical protein